MGMICGRQPVIVALTGPLWQAYVSSFLPDGRRLHPFLMVCISLIIGGGIGNIMDRVRLGYVIDFFEFRIWSYIFNFADVCVVAGCFAVLFYVVFENRFKGGKSV